MAKGWIGLYLYEDRVIVVPVGWGSPLCNDIDPYMIVPAVAECVGPAIQMGFAASAAAFENPIAKPDTPPMRRARQELRVKITAFHHRCSLCSLMHIQDRLFLQFYNQRKRVGTG